jgi:uncharacterized protein (TIGR04255 family)
MSDNLPHRVAAPIIEAVLDIECDMPPAFDLAALEERARVVFRDRYPKLRMAHLQEAKIQSSGDAPPKVSVQRGLQGLQFFQEDEKQLVQVRVQGFSFNRLAPYSSLDEYLPEIERTWRLFLALADPVQVRLVRLRYINRILLPMLEGRVELNEYVRIGPRLPDEDRLTLFGFLNRVAAVEGATGNRVNIVLTSQPPEENRLPIILDIEAVADRPMEPVDWPGLGATIQSLRDLKNMVFRSTLTDQWHKLFQA